MTTKLELTIDPEGLPDWGVWEASREFIQNWLDNPNLKDCDWTEGSGGKGVLSLTSFYTKLPRSSLLVGRSSKREEEDTIGRHGDGLKSAMSVLCRLGIPITIYNAGVTWEPTISYSEIYDTDVLVITEKDTDNYSQDLVVEFEITKGAYEEIQEKCLFFNPPENIYETSDGDILKDEHLKGKIFCGGIYVTTIKDFLCGYNFKPSVLKLDRDRKAVSNFDVQWITKNMWAELGKDEDSALEVAHMLYEETLDTEYISHTAIEKPLEAAVWKVYKDKHEGVLLTDDPYEVDDLKSAGNDKVLCLNKPVFTSIVQQSPEYKPINFKKVVSVSAEESLVQWIDKWYDSLSTDMYDEIQEVLNVIKK